MGQILEDMTKASHERIEKYQGKSSEATIPDATAKRVLKLRRRDATFVEPLVTSIGHASSSILEILPRTESMLLQEEARSRVY